jgi:hypothetical protein
MAENPAANNPYMSGGGAAASGSTGASATSTDALSLWAYLQSQGGQPNVNIPATQKYGMFKVTKDLQGYPTDPGAPPPPTGWIYVANPNYIEKPNLGTPIKMDDNSVIRPHTTDSGYDIIVPASPKAQTLDQQTVTTKDGRVFGIDPSNPGGDLVPRTPVSEDEQKKSAERAQREYNQSLNGHYATDDELLKFTSDLQKVGIDKAAAARTQTEFENTQRRLDAEEKRKQELQGGVVAQQGATLAGTNASTAGTQASTAATLGVEGRAQAKFPSDLAQAGATLAGTNASTAGTQASTAHTNQQIQQGNAPTVQTPQTGMWTYQRDPNTGAVSQTGVNQEYIPKTQAEIAARATQINQVAEAKQAEIMAKNPRVGTDYTPEMAAAEFNTWYDKQVAPHLDVLKAAQQTAVAEEQRQQMQSRQQAMTAALGAGTQAVNAFQATKGKIGYVGPEYQQAVNQIRSGANPKDIDIGKAVEYQGPNPMDLATQGTQNALKYIDSNAAAAAGAPPPNFAGVNIDQAIGRDRYTPAWLSGAAPPPAPPPAVQAPAAAAPAPAGAAAGIPTPYEQLRWRLTADQNEQRLQGAAMPFDPTQYQSNYSPFG